MGCGWAAKAMTTKSDETGRVSCVRYDDRQYRHYVMRQGSTGGWGVQTPIPGPKWQSAAQSWGMSVEVDGILFML